MKKTNLVLICLFGFLWVPDALARVDIAGLKFPHNLIRDLGYFIDETGQVDLPSLKNQPEAYPFVRPENIEKLNFGFSTASYWIRFGLTNSSSRVEPIFLELREARLDRVDIYVIDLASERLEVLRTGDRRPFGDREIDHHHFLKAMEIGSGQELDIYIRVTSQGRLHIPLYLWDFNHLVANQQLWQLVHGVTLGIVAAMILYNLLVFFSTRDINYILYVVYLILGSTALLIDNGIAKQYLFGDYPEISNRAFPVFLLLSLSVRIRFTQHFLDLPPGKPRRFLNILLMAHLPALFLGWVAPLSLVLRLCSLLAIAVHLSILTLGIVWLRRFKPARLLVWAGLGLLAGGLLSRLGLHGWVPDVFITRQGLWLGMVWEAVLLSLALADKINFYRDQTQMAQKKAIDNLKAADKIKDDFLANTSHELRTPLHGMVGMAESLGEGLFGQLSESARSNLATVATTARRLNHLVNDILDFSRLRNRDLVLNPTAVGLKPLSNIVVTLCGPLLRHKPVRLTNAIGEDIPPVWADEDRLQQILHNLIGNAVKFTERGEIILGAAVREDRVDVSVSDTGIGIPEDRLESVFESFEQGEAGSSTTDPGTGIGLSITRQLVELHGGRIRVESQVDRGSRFSFTLPVSRQTVDPTTTRQPISKPVAFEGPEADPPTEGMADPNSPEIWVVDDDPVNLQVVSNQLTPNGYRVRPLSSGLETLERLNTEPSLPHLILLDVMMPKMDGFRVCREIRKKHAPTDLPIIFLTARNQVSELKQGLEIGGNDYLTKPISKSELQARIKNQLVIFQITQRLQFLRRISDDIAGYEHIDHLAAQAYRYFSQERFIDNAALYKEGELIESKAPPTAQLNDSLKTIDLSHQEWALHENDKHYLFFRCPGADEFVIALEAERFGDLDIEYVKTVNRQIELATQNIRRMVLQPDRQLVRLRGQILDRIDDIAYVKSDGPSCQIKTADAALEKQPFRLGQIQLYTDRLIRVSPFHLINPDYLSSGVETHQGKYEIEVMGERIEVGESYVSSLRDAIKG